MTTAIYNPIKTPLMKLLALDTASELCSVALDCDGNITERNVLAGNTHSRLILPMIDELLAAAQLTAADLNGLAFGRGPGSFTGVRIATGVIQGLAFGLNLNVAPVSTLAAIAQDFFDEQTNSQQLLVAVDARMNEIFWAVYQRDAQGYAQLIADEQVSRAEEIKLPVYINLDAGLGSAWAIYETALRQHAGDIACYPDRLPQARAIARLGRYLFQQKKVVSAENALPVYVRDNVAKTEAERAALKL
jgi:tRNA threonylcarbamoyladenosine biosynthesis protein TsaB